MSKCWPCPDCGASLSGTMTCQACGADGPELEDFAAAGLCVDEWATWQQGHCGAYALALIELGGGQPIMGLGVLDGGDHFFAHDAAYAYDSAGRHTLPYRGIVDDAFEESLLGQRPGEWGLGCSCLSCDDLRGKARAHITRHGILLGMHGDFRHSPVPKLIAEHLAGEKGHSAELDGNAA